jgi:photosystem II stability/assembly factor-like uncharacterized protein
MILVLVPLLLLPALCRPQTEEVQSVSQETPSPWVSSSSLAWRELGPSTFGGRIVDIALHPTDSSHLLVASASGGLWRTRNSGTTWDCIFQHEGTISIGDIAWDAHDDKVIWVGTGEANNQRSSYWGDGIYKTTDGGKTWNLMGLEKSQHIGRIVIHPDNSNVVYVAVLGRLYGANEERGLYKTRDGGASWKRVLDTGPTVGVVDLVLDPLDPDTVYAASYERLRRPWNFDGNGPGSGIHKSSDGGLTWKRLTRGLPEGDIGRIGLAAFESEDGLIFASVSNQNQVEVAPDQDPTVSLETRFAKGTLTVVRAPRKGGAGELGIKAKDVLLSLAGNPLNHQWSWAVGLSVLEPEQEVELVLRRGDEEVILTVTRRGLDKTIDAEPTMRDIGGGVYCSQDHGETWTKRSNDPVGGNPAYYYGQIRVDPHDQNRLYLAGVPLYWSEDGGHTWERNRASGVHVDHHSIEVDPRDPKRLWLGNDGGLHLSHDRGETWYHFDNLPLAQFYALGLDDGNPYRVYGGTQDNGTWGGPSLSRNPRGIGAHEWASVGGGDGFYAQIEPGNPDIVYGESQFGWIYRRDRGAWTSEGIQPKAPDGEKYRFNWNSPILLSQHNPRLLWFGGNRLFRSLDRGDHWSLITDDLTSQDPDKIAGNVPHCTITCIAESPFTPDTLMVGTDDGLVQLTQDGGHSWTNLTGRLSGMPQGWWVSRVVLSEHKKDRAYVTVSGYREDDMRPLVWRTEDLGQTWMRLDEGLPQVPVNVLREDPSRADTLYLGTELGVLASLDGGDTWNPLGSGLPTIAVHDIAVQSEAQELVLGTHGRGFWVLDISTLGSWNEEIANGPVHLFTPKDLTRWERRSGAYTTGDADWFGSNPKSGVVLQVHLAEDLEEDAVKLEILDSKGKHVAHLTVPHTRGLHRIHWKGSRGRWSTAPSVGEYTGVLTYGDMVQKRSFSVLADPLKR